MEMFLEQSGELINKINSIQNELNQFEQGESRDVCHEAIQNHLNLKQKIYSISIDPLINEGKNLLKILIGDDVNIQQQLQQQSLLQTAAGTRDSGYSGSSGESTNEKYYFDYFNEAIKIKEPMEIMRAAKQKLQSLWQQKKIKLEQCLQLRIFEQECNQVRKGERERENRALTLCFVSLINRCLNG